MDIIWADYVATHHLEQIPVRIVSDVILDKERENNESIIRRQAVAFENLTPHQENQLRRLIQARGTIPL
jgi:N12 class adenine-specific DNA methylase